MKVKKILCPTDFSGPANEALRVGIDLAKDYAAELLVAHVVEYIPPLLAGGKDPVSQFQDCCRQMEGEARQRLDLLVKEGIPAGIKVSTLIKTGHPAIQISEWAQEFKAELILIATHGLTGWRQAFLGSVTARILLLTTTPVWIVHPKPPAQSPAGRRS